MGHGLIGATETKVGRHGEGDRDKGVTTRFV